MARNMPGQTESAYIGFAVLSSLIDHLEGKSILTSDEVRAIYIAARDDMNVANNSMGSRAANFLTVEVLPHK